MFLLLVARLLPWIPYKIELPILCPSTCSLRARLRPGRAHAPEGGPTGPEAGRTEFSYFRATLSLPTPNPEEPSLILYGGRPLWPSISRR